MISPNILRHTLLPILLTLLSVTKNGLLFADKTTPADQDGPPKLYSSIAPDIPTPGYEALSRYGNPASYQVHGITYHVLRTARGYRDRGIASWYGAKFHNKPTSSGEGYDLHQHTAAHKTLPLPTYVKVKNLSNGREVVVKVNDRGPFYGDRIIDLSYAAAAKLGMLKKGTAAVEIEAITSSHPDGRIANYYLQIGAFSSPESAEGLRDKISRFISTPVFIEAHRPHYIVKIGPLANPEAISSLNKILAQHGISKTFSLLQ